MLPRIKAVTPTDNYHLQLVFSNGKQGAFSLAPYLYYPVYQPLKDLAFFATVVTQKGTVCWGENAEIDFDPETVYLESEKYKG